MVGVGLVSLNAPKNWTPEWPSMAQWWTFVYRAKLPLDIVQALYDIGLPQGPPAVQRTRVQTGYLNAQLAPVARFRQGDVTHVKFQIEMFIIDPIG